MNLGLCKLQQHIFWAFMGFRSHRQWQWQWDATIHIICSDYWSKWSVVVGRNTTSYCLVHNLDYSMAKSSILSTNPFHSMIATSQPLIVCRPTLVEKVNIILRKNLTVFELLKSNWLMKIKFEYFSCILLQSIFHPPSIIFYQ